MKNRFNEKNCIIFASVEKDNHILVKLLMHDNFCKDLIHLLYVKGNEYKFETYLHIFPENGKVEMSIKMKSDDECLIFDIPLSLTEQCNLWKRVETALIIDYECDYRMRFGND